MKYAFINNGFLQDVVMTHPSILFSEGYAKQFVEVPDECFSGWTFDGTTYSPPPPETEEHRAMFIRSLRDEKLQKSDWTQMPDVEIDKYQWIMYRKALRDISLQDGFPWNINWPIAPV